MIADRIRQARLAAGLTLGALGEKVGVSHTAIQKYEKGLLTPSSSQLLKLARACDVRTEYFFRTHSVELLEPEFRKTAAFGKTAHTGLQYGPTRRYLWQLPVKPEPLSARLLLLLPRDG